MSKAYRKKSLEKLYHLSMTRILHYLYWTQQKTWKEVASVLKVTQRTVERWAEESRIEFRSEAHQIMFPSKTKKQIEQEYGQPLNTVLLYLTLQRALNSLPRQAICNKLETKFKPKSLSSDFGGNLKVTRHGKIIFKNGKTYGKEGKEWLEQVRKKDLGEKKRTHSALVLAESKMLEDD